MNDVTKVLAAIDQGDQQATEDLLPLVYEELRKLAAARLAQEPSGQTLQPTALVHEAFLRLVDQDAEPKWDSRSHFFAAAAESMRQILVNRAIKKSRPKHGGDRRRQTLSPDIAASLEDHEQILALNAALEKFELAEPEKSKLVKLRYFAGMSSVEAAEALGISRATAARHWAFAKAWLYSEMRGF